MADEDRYIGSGTNEYSGRESRENECGVNECGTNEFRANGYSESELDLLLYQYSQENRGYFIGDTENGYYPNCQVIMDRGEIPIILSTVVTSSRKGGYGMQLIGRMQVELAQPFKMEVLPMNLLRRGLELISMGNECARIPELEGKYLIKGSRKDFIEMFLPGSGMAEHLAKLKHIGVTISPLHKKSRIHTIQVFCNKNIWGAGIYAKEIDMDDIGNMVELCRETYSAVRRYAMPEK